MSKRRGRNEGSIAQRSDGLWHARVSLGGGKRRHLYAKTKQDVLGKMDALKARLLSGESPKNDRSTVGEFLDRWIQAVEDCLRPKTYAQYDGVINNHIKPRIGHVRLQGLTADHVQSMLTEMDRDGASPRLRELTHAVLRRALNSALRARTVSYNVCSGVDRPRVISAEMRVLDEKQAATLMTKAEELRTRLRALYGLALETGMRFGELLGLRWRDLSIDAEDGGSVTVSHTLQDLNGKLELAEPKTKSAKRTIRVSAGACKALQAHRDRMRAEKRKVGDLTPVFCDRNGRWLRQSNVLKRSFKELLKKAELPPMRFHDLRHSAATMMLARGVNVQVVSRKLGHKDIVVTLKVYGHLLPSMDEHASTIMEAAYSRLWAA